MPWRSWTEHRDFILIVEILRTKTIILQVSEVVYLFSTDQFDQLHIKCCARRGGKPATCYTPTTVYGDACIKHLQPS